MTDKARERGWIVRILDRAYPDGLEKEILKEQLIDLRFFTSENDIRGDVAYLHDKEIIKIEEVGSKCIKRTVISLTAKGKDLIDGTIEVIGVDVGGR